LGVILDQKSRHLEVKQESYEHLQIAAAQRAAGGGTGIRPAGE
jgi:hypothetical protein